MTENMIFWLVLLIIAIVVEVLTMGLTTIWFAGGALVAILATLLHAPIWLQVILFRAVSLLLLFFTRPVAVKYFNKPQSKFEAYKNKICRLLDAYINIGGMSSVP